MKPIARTSTVSWQGDVPTGTGRLSTQSGALRDSPLNFPRRVGEPDGETSPEEMLAASHAGCFAMSLSGACARAGLTDVRLEVEAEVGLERVDTTWRIAFSRLSVTARAEGLDDGTLKELLDAADGSCPISFLVRATADVTVTGRLAD